MQDLRPAAVAGSFYPAAPARLADALRGHLAGARVTHGTAPKAVIVPHAGYVYSGAVAAAAYVRIAALRGVVTRVVLLGPAHRVALRGLAVPATRAFVTPLGVVAIDRDAVELACTLPQVVRNDLAHADEHSLEVQLPFLQTVLGDFSLVPFVVGTATPDEVAAVIELLWGGPETLIVVSSDLSHYLSYADARRGDRRTADSILALAGAIDHDQACGATVVNGFIESARRHGLQPELLDLRNSGDTAGDRERVVGYAAFTFTEHAH
ncbi:MAG: AmmeMemoRadiSam system protein B [Burkholderiales bacterium]|nr:AmmeMemoRadiSam system protein B [Burkholderiales bacterium]